MGGWWRVEAATWLAMGIAWGWLARSVRQAHLDQRRPVRRRPSDLEPLTEATPRLRIVAPEEGDVA